MKKRKRNREVQRLNTTKNGSRQYPLKPYNNWRITRRPRRTLTSFLFSVHKDAVLAFSPYLHPPFLTTPSHACINHDPRSLHSFPFLYLVCYLFACPMWCDVMIWCHCFIPVCIRNAPPSPLHHYHYRHMWPSFLSPDVVIILRQLDRSHHIQSIQHTLEGQTRDSHPIGKLSQSHRNRYLTSTCCTVPYCTAAAVVRA